MLDDAMMMLARAAWTPEKSVLLFFAANVARNQTISILKNRRLRCALASTCNHRRYGAWCGRVHQKPMALNGVHRVVASQCRGQSVAAAI